MPAKHYCLSPKSAMTLLSLAKDTETNKSVWQAIFPSFVNIYVLGFVTGFEIVSQTNYLTYGLFIKIYDPLQHLKLTVNVE